LTTSYLITIQEHQEDIAQNRLDIFSNLSKSNEVSGHKTPVLESDIFSNLSKINDISCNTIPSLKSDISLNLSKINDISSTADIRRHETPDYVFRISISGLWISIQSTSLPVRMENAVICSGDGVDIISQKNYLLK
jgi:hypothetical protein